MLTWQMSPACISPATAGCSGSSTTQALVYTAPASWGSAAHVGSETLQHYQPLLQPYTGLDLALAREACCSAQDTGCSWQQAARTRSLLADTRAPPCPVALQNLCPHTHQK